jgi:hypothetical protein
MTLHATYEANLEAAKEFEDFASDVLRVQWLLSIHVYQSKRRQIRDGESAPGVEIKLDRNWGKTGNLFIETSERWNNEVAFRPAGVNGKCWLYLIGDYDRFWLFGTSTLKKLAAMNPFKLTEAPRESPTAKGFLLPIAVADEWALRVWRKV